MTLVLSLAVVCAVAVGYWVTIEWSMRVMLRDYARAFPDRCAHCGFYRHLRLVGDWARETPPHSPCKERERAEGGYR